MLFQFALFMTTTFFTSMTSASPAIEPSSRGLSIRTILHNADIFGALGGMGATVDLQGISDNGISGSLNLTQGSAFSDLFVRGEITGLEAEQVVNVNVRVMADVSTDCARQGNFVDRDYHRQTDGYLVTSATADADGTVTIDTEVPFRDVTLYAPQGIIKRSVRVSTGESNPDGDILACGAVVSTLL